MFHEMNWVRFAFWIYWAVVFLMVPFFIAVRAAWVLNKHMDDNPGDTVLTPEELDIVDKTARLLAQYDVDELLKEAHNGTDQESKRSRH